MEKETNDLSNNTEMLLDKILNELETQNIMISEKIMYIKSIKNTLSFFKILAIIGLVCFGLSILFG